MKAMKNVSGRRSENTRRRIDERVRNEGCCIQWQRAQRRQYINFAQIRIEGASKGVHRDRTDRDERDKDPWLPGLPRMLEAKGTPLRADWRYGQRIYRKDGTGGRNSARSGDPFA